MTETCPECHTGTIKTRTSKQRSTGAIERRRHCDCCKYSDVITVREVVISLRVVGTTTDPHKRKPQE